MVRNDLARALLNGSLADPFAFLGPHTLDGIHEVRTFAPGARGVELIAGDGRVLAKSERWLEDGLFRGVLAKDSGYRLRIHWPDAVQDTEDPYSFGLLLGELDLHLINEGRHAELSRCLGAQVMSVGGVPGVRFAVWAPNARRVAVVGDFNAWDERRHPMRRRHPSGVWELFLPRIGPGAHYKFAISDRRGTALPLKADPVALRAEAAPSTASIVSAPLEFQWHDEEWMDQRARRDPLLHPLSIYEVHAGSWRRPARGEPQWDELARTLVPYVVEQGFTHIELLPITAHPFGGSWGYQPLGLFAPDARHGEPAAFARFVDACHRADIGVILDWVPAHFPTDEHGLWRFDGSALYEYEDPREGLHQDWKTAIYNFGRHEVRGFLVASALHWLEHYHVDGLRVDAVASMLYRDYSRKPGEWVPNQQGGRENLEAIAFLQQLNEIVAQRCPGAMTIAEESTAWPGVTHPVRGGGLGFTFKWNMGWMHDTLRYFARDPLHRAHHHEDLTFGLLYAWAERYVLPLSHDEVVHGKRSLIGRMPGDRWQRFATLRAYYALMWAYPGKKLLFMGGELAQEHEWNHAASLDWPALADRLHAGVQRVIADLNRLYMEREALQSDHDPAGFQWVIPDDKSNSAFAWLRHGGGSPALLVCNFTPNPRHHYRVGVPRSGGWRELLNTDAACYGGTNLGNVGGVEAEAIPHHGQPYSVALTLPPLGALILGAEG